jgi:hypothetical protein
MSLHLAAASYSYIYIHYTLKKKRKERRGWQRQLYTSREVYSDSSLLADLNRGLVLSIINLRLLYANHELLYTSSLAVKKSKVSIITYFLQSRHYIKRRHKK